MLDVLTALIFFLVPGDHATMPPSEGTSIVSTVGYEAAFNDEAGQGVAGSSTEAGRDGQASLRHFPYNAPELAHFPYNNPELAHFPYNAPELAHFPYNNPELAHFRTT